MARSDGKNAYRKALREMPRYSAFKKRAKRTSDNTPNAPDANSTGNAIYVGDGDNTPGSGYTVKGIDRSTQTTPEDADRTTNKKRH
jgi:hypothetical protein